MNERKPKVRQAILRDIRISLTVWMVLEVLCFGLMPLLGTFPLENIEAYLLPSIVIGVAGILILSFSSGAVEDALTIQERQPQIWRRRIAKFTSVLGFLGITFPMILILIQLWISIRDYEV
ncbi:MAG: hypothetical protein AAFX40_19405 [Cyanobacteria bacterium J06639_1]